MKNNKNKNKAKASERNKLETRSNRHNANYACWMHEQMSLNIGRINAWT